MSELPAKGRVFQKVYIVLQRLTGIPEGHPNVKVSAVKLTRKAADDVAGSQPRSWVERHLADK